MPDLQPHARSGSAERNASLAREWRRLSNAATFVAVLTGPAFFAVLVTRDDMAVGWALLRDGRSRSRPSAASSTSLAHRLIPRASLYGADREALLDDATARRRLWFWRGKFRLAASGLTLFFVADLRC